MWSIKNKQLYAKFEFKDFEEAMAFVNKVASLSEAANHHPKIEINWNTVELWLVTHDKNDTITEKDEQLSKQIDNILSIPQLPSAHQKEIKVYGDGGSRGNPGPAACGFVIMDTNDTVIESGGEYMGITTNNQAEYHSLEMGLERAIEMGAENVQVYMDSMLVVKQISGEYKVRSQELLPRFQYVKSLAKSFKKISFTHVPRAQNALADAEVNKILDSV